MKRVVADASVALKWFFRERDGENGIDQAAGLLNAAVFGRVVLTQPPHFAAEVAGVLARESPATAQRDLQRLLSVEMEVVGAPDHYILAMTLAGRYKQHVFDTLYHALALHFDDAVLVTADERYVRGARAAGRIVRLDDFSLTL